MSNQTLTGDEASVSRTPIGPWEYFPAQNYEGFAIAPKGRLPTLAAVERKGSITVFNYPDATEDHARLIAAAPELLDALKVAADFVCNCSLAAIAEGHLIDCPEPRIRAAIAKAEGRS
jgi:hypothetical protein